MKSWALWCTSIISAPWRLSQEDHNFQIHLGYFGDCLKKQKTGEPGQKCNGVGLYPPCSSQIHPIKRQFSLPSCRIVKIVSTASKGVFTQSTTSKCTGNCGQRKSMGPQASLTGMPHSQVHKPGNSPC